MRETLSLGRIAGVKVGINRIALAIVVLIVSGLASGQLPDEYPGRGPVAYVAAAVVAAVLFLASLLAHELAHAIVARRNGVQVHSIVLWLRWNIPIDQRSAESIRPTWPDSAAG